MPAQLNITSTTSTGWQFGPIRASTDIRTKPSNEDKEEIITTISVTRFRDHENITAMGQIISGAEEVIVGIDGSFQGSESVNVDADDDFTPVVPPTYARWYLTDTGLEPIELQGGKFVRESQEWTTQTPEWIEGGWQ